MKYLLLILFLLIAPKPTYAYYESPITRFQALIDNIREQDRNDYWAVYCCFMLNYGERSAVIYPLTHYQRFLYNNLCCAFRELGHLSEGAKWALLMRFHHQLSGD